MHGLHLSSCQFCLHQILNDPWTACWMTSFSSCDLAPGLASTILYSWLKLGAWINPREPTSTVVRVVSNSFLLHCCARSAYLSHFRAAASSIPVSNGMVSSTMWMAESFQMTMSGLSSVVAMFCGKVYELLGRSRVMQLP